MRSGQLRHKITIDLKTSTRDAYGGESVTWTTNIGVWAAIYPLRGSQYFAAAQVQGGISHKVRIRYATLGASTSIQRGYCRATFGDRVFTIQNVLNPEERNIFLDLLCVEEV
jgi:SPP1 family predicted phage head-tail adaptor